MPLAETIDIIIKEMPVGNKTLKTALGQFISQRFGLNIPVSVWSDDLLADYLKIRIAITDPKGKEICSSRDISFLRKYIADKESPREPDEFILAKKTWEKTGIKLWDFSHIPDSITIKIKKGETWVVFPGLEKKI